MWQSTNINTYKCTYTAITVGGRIRYRFESGIRNELERGGLEGAAGKEWKRYNYMLINMHNNKVIIIEYVLDEG